MSKIKAPLFSLDATGTLDKNITYKGKKQNHIAQKYSKPGSANPFESSPRQKDQRSIVRLITIHWQCMSSIDKLSWETAAKDVRFKGTGYHYFLHMAQQNLTQYLGLVGYWSMNYNVDDKIPDLSGNDNHGTLSPIYPCDCPTLVNSFDKKHGKAASFNGISTYIDYGNSNIFSGFTNFSFEFFFTKDSLNHLGYLFSKRSSAVSSYFCYIHTNDLLSFYIYTTDGLFTLLNVGPVLQALTWYHAAFTYDGSNLLFYLNGLLLATTPATGTVLTSLTSFLLLGSRFSHTYFHNGLTDDFTIFNISLPQEEIKKHSQLI